MSDAHDQHESVIKTPKQLIVAVLAGFLVPIIAIMLLVQFVSNGKKESAGSNALSPEAVANRIQPVADEGYTFKDASGPKVLMAGDAVYKMVVLPATTPVQPVRRSSVMPVHGLHVLHKVTIRCWTTRSKVSARCRPKAAMLISAMWKWHVPLCIWPMPVAQNSKNRK
jgi:hypothetical protein